jgi:hypothetical protein
MAAFLSDLQQHGEFVVGVAEPTCSMLSTRRPRLCTIWTAVAPEAVFTRRTNTPTPRGYPPRQPY